MCCNNVITGIVILCFITLVDWCFGVKFWAVGFVWGWVGFEYFGFMVI